MPGRATKTSWQALVIFCSVIACIVDLTWLNTIGPHELYFKSLVCSRSIADFEIIEQVGEGHLSAVLHCIDIGSGIHVAVKSYHKDRMNIISSRQVPADCTADLQATT